MKTLTSIIRFGVDFIRREDGQLAPFAFSGLLIAYALFMGSAIDMSNLWVHKDSAHAAAEAACASGAADMLWVANQGTGLAIANYEATPSGFPLAVSSGGDTYTNPPAGATLSGSCSSTSQSVAMCAYARANGFDPASSGVNVKWTVSDALPSPRTYNPHGNGGVGNLVPPASLPTTPLVTKNGVLPYLKVTVSETVPTYLLSVLPWFHSPMTVSATCNSGLAATGGSSVEQSLTSICPQALFIYSPSEWEINSQAPNQLRTHNGDNPDGDPVYFGCNDHWIDQDGVPRVWNYLSYLPSVTIDGIQVQVAAGNQDKHSASDGYAHLGYVGLDGSTSQYEYSGENISQHIIGFQLSPDAKLPYAGESQDTTNFTYGSDSYLWGTDSATLLNALDNDRYLGFFVDIYGNEHRDFLGHGGGPVPSIPNMTVYYHTGSTVVASF